MNEEQAREALARHGRSLFARGYSCGTSGNLSVRIDTGGYVMSPTNVSLGRLEPDRLSKLDANGRHVDGPAPTKEAWLHFAMYKSRPDDAAVVHLHSIYATALSCLTDRPPDDVLPAITHSHETGVSRGASGPATPTQLTISQLAVRIERPARQPWAGRLGPGSRHGRLGCRGARGNRKTVLHSWRPAAVAAWPGGNRRAPPRVWILKR
jgi:hypothetical protein